MIRFINLVGQGTGDVFAWFDTCTDTFLTVCGVQTWESWDEFEADHLCEMHTQIHKHNNDAWRDGGSREISRFRSLCPEWLLQREKKEVK